MEKELVYSNAYRIAVSQSEVQIVLQLVSPVVSKDDGKITGVEVVDLKDVRLPLQIAMELKKSLDEQIK